MYQKTAFITGASRGIGRAIALCFANAGYHLAICCQNRQDLLQNLQETIVKECRVSCLTFVGDIGNYETAQTFINETLSTYGHIDVLINNAGRSHIGLLTDMTPQQWKELINTNLTSVFNCCRLSTPSMIHRQQGRIINISSVWGVSGASCEVAYSASKGGVNAFTQALAKELAPSHIAVNAIACGTIDTEMNAFLSDEERQLLTDDIPCGRFGLPDEVAQLALTLAESSDYLTGQIIRLDGGWL